MILYFTIYTQCQISVPMQEEMRHIRNEAERKVKVVDGCVALLTHAGDWSLYPIKDLQLAFLLLINLNRDLFMSLILIMIYLPIT